MHASSARQSTPPIELWCGVYMRKPLKKSEKAVQGEEPKSNGGDWFSEKTIAPLYKEGTPNPLQLSLPHFFLLILSL